MDPQRHLQAQKLRWKLCKITAIILRINIQLYLPTEARDCSSQMPPEILYQSFYLIYTEPQCPSVVVVHWQQKRHEQHDGQIARRYDVVSRAIFSVLHAIIAHETTALDSSHDACYAPLTVPALSEASVLPYVRLSVPRMPSWKRRV